MTDRERLIELIHRMGRDYRGLMYSLPEIDEPIPPTFEAWVADYLLANGVIVPPCKVGDVVYDICTIFDESTLKPKTVIKPRTIDFASSVSFLIESKGLVISEKDFGKTVFLTKEEAENALVTDTNVGSKKECEG